MKNKHKIIICIIISLLCLTFMVSCGNATASVSNVGSGYSDEDDTTNVISWKDAKSYVGEYVSVKGPVVGSKYAQETKGKPTFLNIGADYPDSNRFTVLIWGENRDNFDHSPESYYLGKEVIVSGTIQLYDGAAEIIIDSENEITISD